MLLAPWSSFWIPKENLAQQGRYPHNRFPLCTHTGTSHSQIPSLGFLLYNMEVLHTPQQFWRWSWSSGNKGESEPFCQLLLTDLP